MVVIIRVVELASAGPSSSQWRAGNVPAALLLAASSSCGANTDTQLVVSVAVAQQPAGQLVAHWHDFVFCSMFLLHVVVVAGVFLEPIVVALLRHLELQLVPVAAAAGLSSR